MSSQQQRNFSAEDSSILSTIEPFLIRQIWQEYNNLAGVSKRKQPVLDESGAGLVEANKVMDIYMNHLKTVENIQVSLRQGNK